MNMSSSEPKQAKPPPTTTTTPSSTPPVKVWLFVCNLITSLAWGRVAFIIIVSKGWWEELRSNSNSDNNVSSSSCVDDLSPAVQLALYISFVEVFNCLMKFTRSPIAAVLLFSCTRAGVEFLVGPQIDCGCWQHLLTVLMWGVGDFIRFGCFAIDTALPGRHWVKSIRFMVGPILFPIGALGEMFMVLTAASKKNSPGMAIAALLWPVFFYPMYTQLMKQRRKHFMQTKAKEIKAV